MKSIYLLHALVWYIQYAALLLLKEHNAPPQFRCLSSKEPWNVLKLSYTSISFHNGFACLYSFATDWDVLLRAFIVFLIIIWFLPSAKCQSAAGRSYGDYWQGWGHQRKRKANKCTLSSVRMQWQEQNSYMLQKVDRNVCP